MNTSLIRYGASYRSTTNVAANTAEAVFTAAANVRGAWVHSISYMSGNTVGSSIAAFLANTSAPTTVIDGDGILASDNASWAAGLFGCGGSLKSPVFIPAGKGLYFISGTAETFSNRAAIYTLL